MYENTHKDLKTLCLVLRRTNYGEADRILNLITPVGKFAVMARGVRKSKSKLAGAVEIFTLSEVNLHFGKSELATLTGARMVRFYANIVRDYGRMELASEMLKKVNRTAEQVDNPEFFEILDKCLVSLDLGCMADLVYTWFLFNLARASGEQVNLYTDIGGNKLEDGSKYSWDEIDAVFRKDENGVFDTNTIKVMRLIMSADIEVVSRIKDVEKYIPEILKIARSL